MEEEKCGGEGAPLLSGLAPSSSSSPWPSSPSLPFPASPCPHQAHISLLRHVFPLCLLLLSVATNRGGHVPG